MRRSSTRRAFTLVELIVVVVILGILAGIGLVSYQQVTKRAQDKSIETTVASLAKEAQGLAAYRADGHFVADDLTRAAGDLPALPGGTTAAAWDIKTKQYGFVSQYGQLHIRLAADGSAAGVAAVSQSGNCLLARFTPTGAPTLRLVGPVGGSCSADTALAATPDAPVQWTDPATAGPPSAPAGLVAQLTSNNTVVLTWAANTETDLAGYRITVDHVAQPELLSAPTATLPAVPGEHIVTVVAVDKSALSSEDSAPLPVNVPPAAPVQVTAAVVHGVVTVSWTRAPGATTYRIWHQVGTAPATVLGQVSAPATSVTDTDLPAGSSVTYSVAAANRGGESGATPAGAPITAPTGAPTAVTATASGTAITVSWTAPAGATSFAVYRDGAATPAWTGTGTSWADTGLATGATHSYLVTASNAGGESVPSAATSATTAPSVPAGLVAAAGDGSINLTWQAAPAADGYRIYRSADGATFTLLGQADGTTFTDGSLVNGTHYWYAVAAFNGAGESGQSTAASSTPLPPVPAVPTGVTTSVTGTSVTVTWSEVDRADGYRVYRNGTLLTQATDTSATDTLSAGTSAVYSVAAYNLAGESAQSSDVPARTKSDAPTGVKATAVGTTITVTWTAPTGATSFSVYRDNAATPAWTGTGTSWADTGLPAGTVHNYQVTALNAAGESAKSIPALATTVPPTPTALTATAGDGTVALSWGYDAGAQGFRIYRSADGTTFTLLAQPVLRSYTDATAVNGTTYSYAVAGFNGAGESGQSAPASARPMPPIVATPTGVTTTVTGTTATISWTAVSRADGYRVYQDGNLVKDITAGTSTTTPIAAGTTVSYTVSAYNLSGESGQSAAAPGTAAPAAPTSVTATAASSTAITVAWTAPAGATGFAVYRDGSTTAAWTGAAGSWTDNGLTAGSTHSYTVTASNAAGTSSAAASNTVTLTPAVPAGLTATAGDNTVALTWATTPGTVTGYRLYRAPDAAGTPGAFTMLQQLAATSFSDATATNGTTYWYAVSAYNDGGESGRSSSVSSHPLPPVPATPTGVTASVSGTTATISWATVARADGYRVYKGGAFLVQVTGGTATTDTLPAGATARYTVSAYNLAGESGQSDQVSAFVRAAPPAGVTAAAAGTSITVAWTAPTGAQFYNVYRDEKATAVATMLTGTTWTDTGLTPGTTHNYYVTSINGGGESAWSAPATATTAPAVPAGLTATAGDNTVALTWSAVPNTVTGYRLYRAPDNAGTPGTFTLLQEQPGMSFSDTTAVNGSSYWYAVTAYNAGGESGQSTAASSKPLPPVPATPTGVTATLSGTTVTVSWTAVARADDYNIYGNGGLLKAVSAPATSTTVTIAAGATVNYTVAAHNLAGTSAQSTGSSVTVKPAAPTGVTATATGTTVTVTWAAASGATGYKIYRNGTYLASDTASPYSDSGLAQNGATYSYTVSATNAAGEGTQSASDTATVMPAAVGTPTATQTTDSMSVKVSWSASTGAAQYVVTASTGASVTVTAPTVTATLTLDSSANVYYTVVAKNGAGSAAGTRSNTITPDYAGSVLADGPVAFYRLGESSGTTAQDSTSHNYDGTYSGSYTLGATHTALGSNTAVTFSTARGKVTAPVGTHLAAGGYATVEFWMRPTDGTRLMFPVSFGGAYALMYDGQYNKMFGFNTGNSGDELGVPLSAVPLNTWTHVVAVFHDGSTTGNKIYLNGVLQTLTQVGSPNNATANVNQNLLIGDNTSVNYPYPFVGQLDEVAVYNGTLTQTQITAHAK